MASALANGAGGAPPAAGWPDAVDDVLAGDLTVALATVTPARGVVVTPMANIGLRDRERGTVTVTTSLGLWRKLARIERDPSVALAFHTRAHSASDRREYVLVQGRASFSWTPDRAWLESIGGNWERALGARSAGPLWDRWLRVYHWERVGIEIAAERILVWPDAGCAGEPKTLGAALPADPEPQRAPARGTGPRVDALRAAAQLRRLPHVLAGWVGGDGLPVVAPVALGPASEAGIELRVPDGLLPPGGRRAGLCAHWFTPQVIGEHQRLHTGWLTAEPSGSALYAPHTEHGYRLPGSKLAYRLGVGLVTRRGHRAARRAGVLAGSGSGR